LYFFHHSPWWTHLRPMSKLTYAFPQWRHRQLLNYFFRKKRLSSENLCLERGLNYQKLHHCDLNIHIHRNRRYTSCLVKRLERDKSFLIIIRIPFSVMTAEWLGPITIFWGSESNSVSIRLGICKDIICDYVSTCLGS